MLHRHLVNHVPETKGERFVLTEPEATELAAHHGVQGLLEDCVEQTKQQLEAQANPDAATRTALHVYWALGIVGVLTLGGISLGILALTQGNSGVLSAAEARALNERNLCTDRQQTVMHAIAEYTREHSEPPKDLSVLRLPYLAVPPVDPTSGVPYQYVRQGNAVSLACPQHPLPPKPASE